MNTRVFLRFVAILSAFFFLAVDRSFAADDGRQYYELRVYTTKSEKQQQQVNDYWQNAAAPAYNRMGIKPIGVFAPTEDSPTNKIYVLIPFDSLNQFSDVASKLAGDSTYQKAS